jgi:hypothetical protein
MRFSLEQNESSEREYLVGSQLPLLRVFSLSLPVSAATEDSDMIDIYTTDAIASKTGLSRGGMILVGLLSGNDYDLVSLSESLIPDVSLSLTLHSVV